MAVNLIKKMKERIAQSGSSKREVMYIAADAVKRVRFLNELDEGYEFQFHNDWNAKIFTLCRDPEDHEDCPLCKDGIGMQDTFVWSVWDYDSNEVRLMHFKASGVSPVPSLIEMYEEFGTIMDRDYKIKKVGKGQGSSFVVTPLDKAKFRNAKAKPYSEQQIRKIFESAFPMNKDDEDTDDEDEEEEEAKKTSKKSKSKKKAKKSPEDKLREDMENLELSDLRNIAVEIGMGKKEIKGLNEEELIDEFIDNYEIEDLQELVDDLAEEDDEDDE